MENSTVPVKEAQIRNLTFQNEMIEFCLVSRLTLQVNLSAKASICTLY